MTTRRFEGDASAHPDRGLHRTWIGIALAFLTACGGSPTGDDGRPSLLPEPVLAVAGGQDAEVMTVDETGEVVDRLSMPRLSSGLGVCGDGGPLMMMLGGGEEGLELAAVTADPLRLAWREPVSAVEARSEVGDLSLERGPAAVCPTDGQLFVAALLTGSPGTEGVAVVDLGTRTPVGFVGRFPTVDAVGDVTAVSAAGRRLVVVGGVDGPRWKRRDVLLTVDPSSLSVLDSLFLGPERNSGGSLVREIVPDPAGGRIFVQREDSVLAVSVSGDGGLARVVAAPLPHGRGEIAVGAGGRRVYLPDRGDFFDRPGTGRLEVFDGGLRRLAPFDLRDVEMPGQRNPRLVGVESGPRGELLYVIAGTPRDGPLFPPQPGTIIVVDADRGDVTGTVRLERFSLRRVFGLGAPTAGAR